MSTFNTPSTTVPFVAPLAIFPRRIALYNPKTVCFCVRYLGGRLALGVQMDLDPESACASSNPWWKTDESSPWTEVFDGDQIGLGFDENTEQKEVSIYCPIVQDVNHVGQIGCDARVLHQNNEFSTFGNTNLESNFQKTIVDVPRQNTGYVGQRFFLTMYSHKYVKDQEPVSATSLVSSPSSLSAFNPVNVHWLSRGFVVGCRIPPYYCRRSKEST